MIASEIELERTLCKRKREIVWAMAGQVVSQHANINKNHHRQQMNIIMDSFVCQRSEFIHKATHFHNLNSFHIKQTICARVRVRV